MLARHPAPAWSAAAVRLITNISDKGERRRVRTFRKEYKPESDSRSVTLPDHAGDEVAVPLDKLIPFVDMVAKGASAMVPFNPGMSVERVSATSVVVHAGEKGTFKVYLEDGGTRIAVLSPAKTGTMAHYTWDDTREQFVSIIDGHNALELLARDLIFSLQGVPDF